ncbi:MAG: PD40 domain-containing protein [Bacteroidales bacterium]|nr:PD40 domain-containing protein [Bacteroidales bacterium]
MKKFLSFLGVLLFVFSLYAQENLELDKEKLNTGESQLNYVWRQVKISDDFYDKKTMGGYMFAIDGYLIGYEYNPNYPELNYKLGVSYINSVYKPKGLSYLKIAYSQKKNVAKDIFWQLGLGYQYNYMFDSAIFYFNEYKATLKDYELKKVEDKINARIQECELALKLVENPVNVRITDLTEINSEYPEYCPVITADESKIYFTARRPDCVGATIDPSDGQFYEDVYFAESKDGKWQEVKNPGMPLNTRFHDATVALAPDGNSMLTYRGGDLYICYKRGQKWSYPEPLPENINTDAVENSACFSFDGKTIYFVRGKTNDPKTSNSDIYVTRFVNNKWTDPEKLPDIINSPKDEDGVFIHPDGRTLYFSSLGHGTMGGYDIFKSVKDNNGNWTKPVNMGYPINSPDDDIYFVLSADGKTGYYSSVRQNSEGFSDLYKIEFLKEKEVPVDTVVADNDTIEVVQDNETVYLTLVTGMVYDGISLDPVEAEIKIYDNATDSLILVTNSDSKEGTYIVTLPSGTNYGMNVTADNYLFHSENFDLPKDEAFQRIILDIPLFKITEGAKVVLKNIFFDFDQATLRNESVSELMRVVLFLDQNPSVKIEISGHTDNKGSYDYNKKLSKERAKSVVDFLVSKGIEASRLTYRGAAYDEPVASNETEEGRQMNRRVEFKIISNK